MSKAALGIGTVQFGTPYGVANNGTIPTVEEIDEILSIARDSGVKLIDTASLYGSSELVLGQCNLAGFSIITKTPQFKMPSISNKQADVLHRAFESSLKKLNKSSLSGLLCHYPIDLLVSGGDKIWQKMEALKHEKYVNKIGVSVYTEGQIDQLLDRYEIDIIQIPLNVLDQRLVESGHIERLKDTGIEVHVRSVFLQGLLLMDRPPEYFEPIKSNLRRWQLSLIEQSLTAAQAAFAFARDLPGVDTVLVGVANKKQLTDCVNAFNSGKKFNAKGLACNIPEFVDPSQWQLVEGA